MVTSCTKDGGPECTLLRDVIMADVQLARSGRKCWTREVSDALQGLVPKESLFTAGVGEPQLREVDLPAVIEALCKYVKGLWSSCDDQNEYTPQSGTGTKMAMYEKWMAVPWAEGERPPLPNYLRQKLPKAVIRDMARFRTSSHRLRVETGRWIMSLGMHGCA